MLDKELHTMKNFDPSQPVFAPISVESPRVATLKSAIKTQALSRPINTFTLNINAIIEQMLLAQEILAYGEGFGAASAMSFMTKEFSLKDQIVEVLEAEFKTKAESSPSVYGLPLSYIDLPDADIEATLNSLEDLKSGVQSFLSFATVAIWTLLESLAKDAWVEIINAYPMPLAQKALNADGYEAKGNESKSINSRWLSKYGFDLRDSMGFLLVDDEGKFKFDSPDQILQAYKSVFGKSDEFNNLWKSSKKVLNVIYLTRNLVAHKAGIVDEKFCRRTKLNFPIGSRLTFNTTDVSHFLEIAIDAGCDLLEFVEGQIVKLKL